MTPRKSRNQVETGDKLASIVMAEASTPIRNSKRLQHLSAFRSTFLGFQPGYATARPDFLLKTISIMLLALAAIMNEAAVRFNCTV